MPPTNQDKDHRLGLITVGPQWLGGVTDGMVPN
ncbi:hypothetical protein IW245_002412 [Longispora fulva]|uniref:Uncharacterized protein n=1 Tax=Longispora fulva TaxID=619741 RepID=A0A8J7G9G6_9ACTN|nr:hypothetical protein [Longispora fulva]